MYYSLQSEGFQSKLWENTGFSAQPGIYLGALNNFKLQQPPLEEQIEIVNYLESKTKIIDKGVKSILDQIEKLKEYRTAFIFATVTGKIDIRESV